MNVDEQCVEYLKKHNIPFKKRIRLFKDTICIVEFDFIIPGAIVNTKTALNNKKISKLITQLEKQLLYVPADFLIYLYIKRIPTNIDLEDELIISPRIKIINDFNEIKSQPIEYYILDPEVIISLASIMNTDHKDLINKYKNKVISTPQKIYDRSTIIMNDLELANLAKFNIKINDQPSKYMLIIHSKSVIQLQNLSFDFKNINQTFNVFVDTCKSYTLQSSIPNKHINGITSICNVCNGIYFVHLMKDDKCIKCENNINYIPIGKARRDFNKQDNIKEISLNLQHKQKIIK